MLRQVVTGGTAAGVVVALGFSSGGYFPGDWGLLLLASALCCSAVFLIAERASLGRLDAALVGALLCLAAWQLLSAAWSSGADGPVLEAERTLVYAVAAAALLLVLTAERVPALLAGLSVGIVLLAIYALATRVAAGHLGDTAKAVAGARLDEPIGYANALGILVVLAILLLAGLALGTFTPVLQAAASASLVPLAAVLWLTLSRGAIVALAVGAGVLVVLAPERGRAFAGLLVLTACPMLAVLVTARSDLGDPAGSLADAQANGQALAGRLLLVALAAAAAGAAVARVAARLAPAAVVLCSGMLAVAVTAVVIKGPVQLADRAVEGFRTTPPVTSRDSDRRLLTLSGSWRADYWTVAWSMVEREPLFGEGGGSFERWWLQERPVASYARDAHNLYLETLAELGPAGLALLVAALAVPLAALRRVSRRPLRAAAAAAYVAFLVHGGLDWDWEVPLVTLPAIAFAASLVVLARRDAEEPLSRSRRMLGATAVVVVVLISLVVHVGNRAVGAAEEALASGAPAAADDRARRARGWMPWAAHPWQLLGEAQLSLRRDVRARASLAEAVQRDPERWSAWYGLAVASHGRARALALARAEELNPLSPEIADLRRELQTDS